MKDVFEIYVETYAKVKSGKVLDHNDFGEVGATAWEPYDEKGKLAVAIAAEDVDNQAEMHTKSELDKEIDRRLS